MDSGPCPGSDGGVKLSASSSYPIGASPTPKLIKAPPHYTPPRIPPFLSGKIAPENDDESQLQLLDDLLVFFDRELSGKVPPESIGSLLRSAGKLYSYAEVQDLESKYPEGIDLAAFRSLVGRKREADVDSQKRWNQAEQELRKAFAVFRRNEQTEFVRIDDLQHVLTTVGEKLSNRDFDTLVALCGWEKKPAVVNFEQFCHLFTAGISFGDSSGGMQKER